MSIIKTNRDRHNPTVTVGSGVIQVIDNFLPEDFFREIQSYFLGDHINWNYLDGIIVRGDKDGQFAHTIYDNHKILNQNSWDACLEIAKYIDDLPGVYYRIKANFMPPTKEHYLPDYHTDHINCITAIFYLTTTNGKTVFHNGGEVECIENRMVIFDSNLHHSGYTSTDNNRVLINFNYVPAGFQTIIKAKNEYNANNEWTG